MCAQLLRKNGFPIKGFGNDSLEKNFSVTLNPSNVILSVAKNLVVKLRTGSVKGLQLWENARFFAEFILSAPGSFDKLRMTRGGEGLRMTIPRFYNFVRVRQTCKNL